MTSLKKEKDTISYFLKSFNTEFSRPLDQIWSQFDEQETGALGKEDSRKFMKELSKVIE